MDELEEFKIEILETLESAEQALLAFDQLPDGQSSGPLYDEVFRAYHNIKGAAGMLEWVELQQHVHQLENVLMQTKATSSIPKKSINWFLKGNDATRSIIAGNSHDFNYQESGSSVPDSNTKVEEKLSEEFYAEISEAMDRITNSLIKIESGEGTKEILNSVYRDTHSVKGAVQLFGLEEASLLAHAMESSLEPYRECEKIDMDRSLSGTLLLCVDLMNQCVSSPNGKETLKEVTFMVSLLSPFQTEVKEDGPKTEIKELEVISPKVIVQQVENKPAVDSQEKIDSTIRVQVSLLDRLMTLMGEMVLVRNQVLQYSNSCEDLEFLNLSQKLNVVTSELQEETMKTRMQPIGNVLSKFQRVVRDLSGSLNKKINLNLIGVETELDKSLIEAVKDPLTHIVRNACDHGIESPEERRMSGKNETGTITIEAYHEGGQVIVDISDDGKGLNREKLLNKAIERGIVSPDRTEEMTDREVQALIFAPGLSTAEKVTNVSGRGVGMDVVKSNIEKIGGIVDISSVEGKGSKITLKIPLTLAIVPALIVKACNDRYAIPQVKLVELVRIEKKSIEYLQGRPIYRLRGNILPLVNLKEVFNMVDDQDYLETDAINIVVLNSQNNIFGMIVDEIMDTADIVVKPLARFLKPLSIYSGATVLGDGSVAFILDILGIAQKHLGSVTHTDEINAFSKDSRDGAALDEFQEYVLFNLGATAKHAIPLSFVCRMEEFKSSSFEYSGPQKVARYRGGILKIISLDDVFNYTKNIKDNEISQVIVVKLDDQFYGIEVGEIIDVMKTQAYLDDSLDSHPVISGNLVTENEIIVVVNIENLINRAAPENTSKLLKHNFTSESSFKILLLEDTDSIRKKVKELLEDMGHTVHAAVDGVDGLKKLAEQKLKYDLIISDIEMPKMNGYEFTKKVRSVESMKEIPIIAFTTKNSEGDIRVAKQAGFTSYLEKSKIKLLSLLINECMGESQRKSA